MLIQTVVCLYNQSYPSHICMYLSHICTSVATNDANNLIQGDRKEIVHTILSKIYRLHTRIVSMWDGYDWLYKQTTVWSAIGVLRFKNGTWAVSVYDWILDLTIHGQRRPPPRRRGSKLQTTVVNKKRLKVSNLENWNRELDAVERRFLAYLLRGETVKQHR